MKLISKRILKSKSMLLSLIILGLSLSMASCGEITATTIVTKENESVPAVTSKPSLSGILALTGSTSMADVANGLAEAFKKANPGVTVSVGGNGSGEGPTAVKSGTAQIGLLSRDLKDSEDPTLFQKYIIGYDGILVVVNPQLGVTALSTEQVQKIFSHEIINWSEVGGSDQPIQCVGREAASGTRSAFEELIKIENPVYAMEQNSTGNIKQVVASNPNAIGYISISALDSTIVALNIDGVTPSEETVKSGDYSLQRPFLMITKADTKDALTLAFLDYVFSPEGMKIVADDGIVPNPDRF